MAENGCYLNVADTNGKAGFENGIHEVGGSIPPGSTIKTNNLIPWLANRHLE
jgi:hypothetical protein